MAEANWLTVVAAVVSVTAGGLLTFFTTRLASRRTAREEADETEVTVRAQFVTHLTGRISDLEGRLDRATQREQQLVERTRSDMDGMEQRYRHLTNNLVLYTQILVIKLKQQGIDVPKFTGWDIFVAEGGAVKSEWVRGFMEDDASDHSGDCG